MKRIYHCGGPPGSRLYPGVNGGGGSSVVFVLLIQ